MDSQEKEYQKKFMMLDGELIVFLNCEESEKLFQETSELSETSATLELSIMRNKIEKLLSQLQGNKQTFISIEAIINREIKPPYRVKFIRICKERGIKSFEDAKRIYESGESFYPPHNSRGIGRKTMLSWYKFLENHGIKLI